MAKKSGTENVTQKLSFEDFKKEILNDYRIASESRETSLLGRKEVLTGKAKFGIFGDGKEVAQIAMAKVFRYGDFRSGYYRDQTFMLSTGTLTLEQWFAGLYAHADAEADPMSAGRQMGGHYSTGSLNPDGTWKDLTKIKNSSSDISPAMILAKRSYTLFFDWTCTAGLREYLGIRLRWARASASPV